MKHVLIREPHENEYKIWSNLYQVYLDFYRESLTENELKKVWSWLFETPQQLHCYVAEVDEKVVGLAHFRKFLRPTSASTGIYLDDLIVLPEYRRQKIGYHLIDAIKSYAKENNLSKVRWITAADNKVAMRLYDGVGYKTNWVTYDAKLD